MRLAARVAVPATALFCVLASPSLAASALVAGSPETISSNGALLMAPSPNALSPTHSTLPNNILTLAPKAPAGAPLAAPAADSAPKSDGSLTDLVKSQLTSNTDGDEHECLATSVYFEAKGETYQGQLAVAQTIINRTKSGRFPSTVCGVVKQPHQFGFVRHGAFPTIARAGKQWHEAVAIASIALKSAWASVAEKALYFNVGGSPAPGLVQVARFGAQAFYR
jgi:spore germination cell wall hydrolase CwlJ-like protein